MLCARYDVVCQVECEMPGDLAHELLGGAHQGDGARQGLQEGARLATRTEDTQVAPDTLLILLYLFVF